MSSKKFFFSFLALGVTISTLGRIPVCSPDHPETGRSGPSCRLRVLPPPRFRVLVLFENGGHHLDYTLRARPWLDRLAADSNFKVDYITNTDSIDDAFLDKYQLFIQLDYAPYGWKAAAEKAFQRYIEEGRGGWIGFHHASLLGEFDGYPIWPWFRDFMGGIRWKNYIARFAKATVRLENPAHPVLRGIPDSFTVQKEEWYTYDRSPRPHVQVLARVDESSYFPDTSIKMGDHPVIWSNDQVKARNVYIFMGHDPVLFDDPLYTRIFTNAIFWASATPKPVIAPGAFSGTDVSQGIRHAVSFAKGSKKVLGFYSGLVERDHVDFAMDAIRFYDSLAKQKHFQFDTTSDWSRLNDRVLSGYQVIVWLNDFPKNEVQRESFRKYMENGGAWLGFHVSAYNDKDTHWPWFVEFLGGGVFYTNNWPPLRAKLVVDDRNHPVTRGLPAGFIAPINEWYSWEPSPRLNNQVKVLVTLDSSNYPLGKKDLILKGDLPVVWTHTKYKMLYMNMGHGDQIFQSRIQNRLIAQGLLWLLL